MVTPARMTDKCYGICSTRRCSAVVQRSAVWWRCSAVQRIAEQNSAVLLWCGSAVQSSALQWRCSAVQWIAVVVRARLLVRLQSSTLYQYWTTVQLAASHYSAPLTTFAPTGQDCGEAATTARTSAPDSRYMADLHSPVPTLYLYWQRPLHSALLFILHCILH
jgi:hypothetical protein